MGYPASDRRRLTRIALVAALFLLAPAVPADAGTGLACETIPRLMRGFVQNHARFRQIDPEIERRTIEIYVRRLDPTRTLLLESEVEQARASLAGIFQKLEAGDCVPLTALAESVAAHHRRTEAFAREVIGAPDFELDPSMTLVVDPDERGQPATPEQRDAVNRRLVHFQLSNYLAAGTTLDQAKERLIHRYELRSRRAEEVEAGDLHAALLDSFANALDPHSNYLSAEVLEDFQIGMRLSLEGIGVALSERDGFAVAERIIPGGAADRHDVLRPKDKIIAVAQEGGPPVDIIDMPLRDAVALIRGKAGTKVLLTVLREGDPPERFNITIERDKIDLSDRAASLRFVKRKVGERELDLAVLELSSFYGDASEPGGRQCADDVAKLLREAAEAGADGLLLDLSGNGGGVLEHAVTVSGFFVRSGEIVRIVNALGQNQPLWDRDDGLLWSGPLVVHTSRVSASASEILAGALKDYRRAVVTGDDHTFGKGTVQTVSYLSPGLGALKITTALFFRPGGRSTQKDGVSSDVVIPSPLGRDGFGEASQDYALDGESVDPFLSRTANGDNGKEHLWQPLTDEVVEVLRRRSAARVAKSETFDELRQQLAEAEEDRELRLSDILEKGEKTEDADEAEDDEPTPQLEEALSVLADLVLALES